MCRERHRVENRVGEVQARGGVGLGGAGWGGWGGVVTYFADLRCVLMVRMVYVAFV